MRPSIKVAQILADRTHKRIKAVDDGTARTLVKVLDANIRICTLAADDAEKDAKKCMQMAEACSMEAVYCSNFLDLMFEGEEELLESIRAEIRGTADA